MLKSGVPISRIRELMVEQQDRTRRQIIHSVKNRRHTKRSTSDGTVTLKNWKAMVDYCDDQCLACGAPGVTQDHVDPLSKTGVHSIFNIQPLCLSCNSSKGNKADDYRPEDWPW